MKSKIMPRKNSVATRKRSTNTQKNSPAIQTSLEKLMDQHQHNHQISSQTQAPSATTVVSFQLQKNFYLVKSKKLK